MTESKIIPSKCHVLVGLSWWVDSAVSAYLLKQEWYDVTAGFMINYLDEHNPSCPTREDIVVARDVAQFLDIPFFTFDYRDEYEEKVLEYMYEGYAKGITPNPDIMCNSEVKFRVFLEEALELWFDLVAMGHYAQILCSDEEVLEGWWGYSLLKWKDPLKDQSYFLAGLNQAQLSKTLFPIGHLEKSEVREIAHKIGLPNAWRKDSQWICFVWKVNMAEFLEKKIEHKEWNIIDANWKILWKHKWVFYYTIGQRKGLDIGGQKEPIFVTHKNILTNEITVGTSSDETLYTRSLIMHNMHVLSGEPLNTFLPKLITTLGTKQTLHAKIRYRQKDQACMLSILEWWGVRVDFVDRQRAVASGQICAIYHGEELVMSGVIV